MVLVKDIGHVVDGGVPGAVGVGGVGMDGAGEVPGAQPLADGQVGAPAMINPSARQVISAVRTGQPDLR